MKFKSATTLNKPADSFTVQVLRTNGMPIKLDMEVRPVQGTFTIEYDNRLQARYQDSSVSQGGPRVDVNLDWIYAPVGFGYARLREAYYIRPIVEIHLDELFARQGWGAVADSLPLPSSGDPVLRRPAAAAAPIELQLFDDQVLDQSSAANAIILGQAIQPFSGSFARADTVSFTTTVRPYPCLRVDLDMVARLDYQWSFRNTEACIRYSSDPTDTTCWAATDSFTCISAYQTVTIPVEVGCEEVRHLIVPFCPVTAQGELTLSVKLQFDVKTYTLAYDCTDLPAPPAISAATSSPVDTLVVNQTLAVNRADNDAIFAIDVPVIQPAITAPGSGSSLTAGQPTTIQWDPSLPADLLACCSDSLLVDLFYDTADTTQGCAGTIASRTPNDGSFTWTPPVGLACAGGTTSYVITARFFCDNASKPPINLAHSQSGQFSIVNPGTRRAP